MARKHTKRRGRPPPVYPTSSGIVGASHVAIQQHFAQARATGVLAEWIAASNVYRLEPDAKYDSDTSTNSVNVADLAEYVAASAATHAIDAWSYLARAISALFKGDRYVAIHLGYYCELRAAMAILASHGVGVLNHTHAIIKAYSPAPLYAVPMPSSGTHEFSWIALQAWSQTQDAANFLNDSVAPAGISFDRWLAAARGSSSNVLASSWFPKWGIDLKDIKGDRRRRNSVSYRPSEFRRPPATDVGLAVDFVIDLWRLFEPSAGRRFHNLEFALVQSILPTDRNHLRALINRLGLPDNYAEEFSRTRNVVLSLAQQQSAVDGTSCDLEVIARAALLLAFATSGVRTHLTKAAYNSASLDQWIERFSSDRGIRYHSKRLTSPTELWADVSDAVDEVKNWRATSSASVTLAEWHTSPAAGSFMFSAFEAAGIWGIVP